MSHNYFNHSFANYYQETKPLCSNYDKYIELPFGGEHNTNTYQNFSFCSNKLFFDPNPPAYGSLDPSRYSTDSTEINESPITARAFSSEFTLLSKGEPSQIHHTFSDLRTVQGQENKLIAVIGESTGITFNSLSAKLFQSNSLTDDKLEDDFDPSSRNLGDDEQISSSQLKSLLQANIWSKDKDNMLLKLGSQFKCDWKKMAKRFHNRILTPCFFKNRYKELIDAPFQRRVKFTHKEDLLIAKYFERYGSC